MNKCEKCGTEFEGKFCPECGTPWLNEEEKICPKCKAVLKASAKFCSECGYSFETQSAPAPAAPKPAAHTGSGLLMAYKIASFLPEILFVLISVLAFIFLAAPVTKITSAGQFLGVMDVGSGYHVVSLSGVNGLRNPAIALIIFAALGLAFALLCACSAWRNKKSMRGSYGFFIFYLVYLIIASVMIANTASLDEGLGVLGAGACPVCFLVFAILFAAGHAASLIAHKILNKKPEVKEAQAAKEEAEKARREEFYATHKEPVMRTPKSSKQVKKCAVIYKYEKRYYNKGKEKTPSAALVFLDMHKVVLGIAAVVLTVAIILMATLIPYANNKFRMGVVKKISLGDNKTQVADVLGEPYGADRNSNDWFYYDKDLLSYVEKGQSLSKQQEEAIAQGNLTRAEQLANEYNSLMAQVASKAFKCIEVTFADEKVESVLFDTRYSFEPKAKETKEYELWSDVLVGYYVDETVSPSQYRSVEGTNTAAPYEVRFKDGSYYKTYVKNGTVEIARKNYNTTEYTFLWNDKYGNYSEKIPTNEVVNIGTVNKDGVWSANSEGIKKLKMTEFAVPDGVTSIRSRAFADCSGLTRIVIPDSVTQIKDDSFIGCNGLEGITVAADNQNFSSQDGILYNKTKTEIIAVPQRIKGVVTIPDSVVGIGTSMFSGCSRLTSITIPDSVTSIGKWAFHDCSGLTDVVIPDSVTIIEEWAFYACRGLTNVRFNGTVEAWQAIEKGELWDYNTGDYTVTCTDGTVDKKGNVTYFE